MSCIVTAKPKPIPDCVFEDTYRVVAGFPGVGKSTLFKNSKWNLLDSDSSKFPKDNFPLNYMEHISSILNERGGSAVGLLVSSHALVREALVKVGIPFILAYPRHDCKEEYIQRYRDRQSPEAFIKLLEVNFDNWVNECMAQEGCFHLVLLPGQFLADQLDFEEITGEFLPS